MNDITKEKLAFAILNSIEKEKMLYAEVADILDIDKEELKLIKAGRWEQISSQSWKNIRNWKYSGCRLRDYKLKNKKKREGTANEQDNEGEYDFYKALEKEFFTKRKRLLNF